MYRKIIVLFFVGLAAFSMLPSTQADSGVINIGTIPYGGFQNIMINRSYDVNLSLIYTPVVNDVAFQKLGFNPLTNSTVYYIQSLGIPIDYTFRNDSKPSLFQDSMGQVYRLFIDYRNVTVPPNPLFVPYVNLTMLYNKTLGELGRLNMSLVNLTLLMNVSAADWNASLSNWSSNYSSLSKQFIYMSLNASMENTRANMLATGKKNDEDTIFRISIIFPLVIIFSCIASIYLGKRMKWFNPNKSRKINRIETGFSKISGKIDKFIVKKNDSITRNEEPAVMETQEQIEEPRQKEEYRPPQMIKTGLVIAKAKTTTKATTPRDMEQIHNSVDKI